MKKETLKKSSVLVIACICWLGITGCSIDAEISTKPSKTAHEHQWGKWSDPVVQPDSWHTSAHVIQHRVCSDCGECEVKRTY